MIATLSKTQGGDDWEPPVSSVCNTSSPKTGEADAERSYFYLPHEIRDFADEKIDPSPSLLSVSSAAQMRPVTPATEKSGIPAQDALVLQHEIPLKVPPVLATVGDLGKADILVIRLLTSGIQVDQIHSLFRVHRQFLNIDPFKDLDIRISPALFLASRMLLSAQALHFYNTLLFGPRTTSKVGVEEMIHRPLKSTNIQGPLPLGLHSTIFNLLMQLAPNVEFVFASSEGRKGVCCTAFQELFDYNIGRFYFVRHKKVQIQIDFACVVPGAFLMVQDLSTVPVKHLLRNWFKIAVALLVGVARAMSHVFISTPVELRLAGDHTADYGQALERWLFGLVDPEVVYDDARVAEVFQVFVGDA